MRQLVVALVLSTASLVAGAVPVNGLFNTGTDGSGAVLPSGSDPHYSILGGGPGVVMNSLPASWLPNTAASKWIWQNANGQPTNLTLTFRTTFDLSGFDPASVSINGRWATDNFGRDILLNGVSTGQTSPGFGAWTNFSLGSGFAAGINTLDFVVQDVGFISGFRAEFLNSDGRLVDPNQVPEPTTAVLAMAGFAALRRRRLNSAV